MGPIAQELVTFDQQPQNAWALPLVLYPLSFSLGVAGYAGDITLSAGVLKTSTAIVEAFLEQIVKELPA